MFSPTLQENGPAKGTRSSRRRQRPLSAENSVQQPKAKRQRVPLSETTFANPDAAPETFEVKSDQIDLLGAKSDGIENVGVPRRELSVRFKKPKAGERPNKGDGSVVLTQNNAYTVSKLPALPDRLRADAQNRQQGAIYSSSGYALSLTHTHAFVWPYASTASSPETFVFTLPYPSKHLSDPLPLGSLVPPSAASDEPGLVVVMPVSGKIAYWESIASAATLDFIRQQRNGVEDAISGMFSGEHVVQIVNAETSGFILVLSSGRLAYMSVRDTHGRPGISVQFLRNGLSSNLGAFFGNIRNAFTGSSSRTDIAAARAGHGSNVGERVIVAVTTKGRLSSWKIHRGGQHELLADTDIRDKLIDAVRNVDRKSQEFTPDSFQVLDLTFIPRGLESKYIYASRFRKDLMSEAHTVGSEMQHCLLLVSHTDRRQTRYAVVEVLICADGIGIFSVRPLTSYTTPVRPGAAEKPRLHLPRPGLIAFVVFDRAVVVASMGSPPDSPEVQLLDEAHILPASFEDVIDFRDEDSLQVVGSGIEEPTSNDQGQDGQRTHRFRIKNPAVVLLLQGVGTVRVAVTDVDRFTTSTPPQITAKSKLEQAVFFGVKGDNPLVFRGKRQLPFSAQDIGNAAIGLSNEILSSKTPFISNIPASLENNLRLRISYLDGLIAYLSELDVEIDAVTRWKLLYNAEKLAVARWVWQKHEQFLEERPQGERTVVSQIVAWIHETNKTDLNMAAGEVDPVRHWFIHDVWRFDIFLAWTYQIIKIIYTKKVVGTDDEITRLAWEAATLKNGALFEARQFRLMRAREYGVDSTKIPGGNGFPEPWMATHLIIHNHKRLIEFCFKWLESHPPAQESNQTIKTLLESIRALLPALISQHLQSLADQGSWASESEIPEIQARGKLYIQAYQEEVYDKVSRLKDFDLWEEAIQLAKEYKGFEALAEIVVQQILFMEQKAASAVPQSVADDIQFHAEEKKKRMGRLFDEYEEKFAFRAYEVLLESSGVQAVLDFPYDRHGYATRFLRTKPELAKISWINDVQREKDLDHAAETLLNLGLSREQQVWNKKIELSLGKLAFLAEEAEQSVNGDGARSATSDVLAKTNINLEKIEHELELIKIQDNLYSTILPIIRDGVDESAELELVLKEHAVLIPKRQKALYQIFEDGMSRLLKHEALHPATLIDLLTLADLGEKYEDAIADPFCLALKVAKYGLKGEERAKAVRLIWRRCFVRDDWKVVNQTKNKGDDAQLELLGNTATYHTLFAVYEQRLSDEKFNPFVKPSECLGVYTEELDRRFSALDDAAQKKILENMKWEDDELRTYIEKARADAWYLTTKEYAKKTVTVAFSELTAAGKSHVNGNGSAVSEDAARLKRFAEAAKDSGSNGGGLFGV
ncbi:Non-repetitive/WGA-negative nucleoporin C-terminal-domain-containing protein [Apiosordaria backusii]|uniref:Non-repetitive/WGA-negative nucleoporin C-terminal-domain-containing protein n=1 Tax=Apiosordaria backusii TaxID=314023 RepID=A0AA39ZPY4_9PEZI|nr:Non-repetitive/WGA-negative nucleoporin C-terminal-domain-containing protein [Apiosordaria backusii]